MVRDTLIDFFHDLAATRGEFLVYDDGYKSRRHSYADVARAAVGFAARLRDAGLRKGDKVIFWSENRPEWIVAFWGCLLDGIVVVPIDYRASPDFLARVAGIVDAKLLLIGVDVPPVPGVSAPVWRMDAIDWSTPHPGTRHPGTTSISRDDVAEIIFTSGATADPKGVVITHRNILANIVPVEREMMKYRRYAKPFLPVRFLNLLPLSHMFGQAMATFVPPMLPGVVVFMRGFNPIDIIGQIKQRRISVLVSVPKILDVLKEHVDRVAGASRDGNRAEAAQGGEGGPPKRHWLFRWGKYRAIHRMFGWKFWSFVVGAAPLEGSLEAFWGERGFLVVQGYGLTETAPIVTLNHPFGTKKGSVGKPIAGVDIKIAEDGEILVRGENVTQGYFNAPTETAGAFEDGWFHTGDVGELTDGQLFIRGRKKEMIVTPEGLNVFPEDVERVINAVPGVRDSAVVGVSTGGQERVHAVIVADPGVDPDDVARQANAKLEDHQRIRRALVWPERELPRTEGTKKLKRAAIRDWVRTGAPPRQAEAGGDRLASLVAKYAGRESLAPGTTIEELGLSSLERVELMVALEDKFQTRIDERAFSEAKSVDDLRTLVERAAASDQAPPEPVDFPIWTRSWWARAVRRVSLPTWILPLARVFAWLKVEGREHLDDLQGPVIFASNHQSFMDGPVIMAALPARWRYNLAPAMRKEMFSAHFFPAQHTRGEWFRKSLEYYLSVLFFNAFPLPQREAGARQTLRYIGDVLGGGTSVLIFPEGKRSETGEIDTFRPGIGMIASRLDTTVVPVRIRDLDKVLGIGYHMARPGRVRVTFGKPMKLSGEDYEALAKQVEDAVRRL